MTVLWWVALWLLLGPPVLLLVVALCRAGHQEDVARHYVDEDPGLSFAAGPRAHHRDVLVMHSRERASTRDRTG